MATDIIKQLQATTANRAIVAGVTINKSIHWCDTFYGTDEALIAAGVITAEQLPGQAGMPKVAATFYNGILCQGRKRVPRDANYLNVCRPVSGKKVTVTVGVDANEQARRIALRDAEDAAMLAARHAKQAAISTIALSEGDFRAMGSDLVMMLWRLGRTEGRSRIEDFPFELTDDSAETLCTLLQQIQQLFKAAPLQPISGQRANLLKARRDSTFQAFLQLQCIPAAGASHA